VSSQPTMGISEGRCTRSTLSMLHSWQSSPHCNPINHASAATPRSHLSRSRIPAGSAIYFTRIPASLDGPTQAKPCSTIRTTTGSCREREGSRFGVLERESRVLERETQKYNKGLKILGFYREVEVIASTSSSLFLFFFFLIIATVWGERKRIYGLYYQYVMTLFSLLTTFSVFFFFLLLPSPSSSSPFYFYFLFSVFNFQEIL